MKNPYDLVVADLDKEQLLRRALFDARKEYSSLHDVLVEGTQNALDALDEYFFRSVIEAIGFDPTEATTVNHWNTAVRTALQKDYEAFEKSTVKEHELAGWYAGVQDQDARKSAWVNTVAKEFDLSAKVVGDAYEKALEWKPRLEVRYSVGSRRVDIIDNGVGMVDIFQCMRRGATTKSREYRPDEYVRLGCRGIHGWGFISLLARCNSVRVASAPVGGEVAALGFRNFLGFIEGTDKPEFIDLSPDDFDVPVGHGTHLVLEGIQDVPNGVFEDIFKDLTPERFGSVLRALTPVGQVCDFVGHPAYHTLRAGDVEINVTDVEAGTSVQVPFECLRVSEFVTVAGGYDGFLANPTHYDRGSVHVLHRYRSSKGDVYLGAAEIQEASVLDELQKYEPASIKILGKWDDAKGRYVRALQRGVFLAHSGGMRSEVVLLEPTGNRAMIRGVCLCDTLSPTIGRKSVVADKRQAASRAASRLFSFYDQKVRKRLKGAKKGGIAIKSFAERRKSILAATSRVAASPPPTADLYTWATSDGKEARVMAVFSELLGRGIFGNLRLISVGLRTTYDFEFLYWSLLSPQSTHPNSSVAEMRRNTCAGGVEVVGGDKRYFQYGIGEFKSAGEDVLDDFELDGEARKDPNAVDLLVCWDFDESVLGDKSWEVDEVTDATRVFCNETHQWTSSSRTIGFPISVIRLRDVVDREVKAGRLEDLKVWLPALYF